MARRKKYQFGDPNYPQAKMKTELTDAPPNKDILRFLLSQQGEQLTNQYKRAGYSLKADDNNVIASRPTGEYKIPGVVQGFNAAAYATTGIANRINDIKSGQNEYKQYLEALQPVASENYNEEGLNNLPIYTKYGGGTCEYGCGDVDHAMINEMMKNGGWIAGAIQHPGRCSHPGDSRCPKGSPQYNLAMRFKHGDLHHAQLGYSVSPKVDPLQITVDRSSRMSTQEMGQFNRFNDFVRQQGYGKSDKLNNQNFSRNLYSQFQKANPDVQLNYEQMIPKAQSEQYMLKQAATSFAQRHDDPNASVLMNNITPFDAKYGPKTNSYDFPNATLNTFNNNQLVGSQNLGLVRGTRGQLSTPSTTNYSMPKGATSETLMDSSGKSQQYYLDPQSGDYVKKMPYGGGPLTSEGAKEILRDGTVHGNPLTPKQRKYFGYIAGGGKPKKQMGGDENDMNDTPQIEAEEGEVYQTPQGQVNKVPDSAPTHEQGGVVLNDAERVLENTSELRKDKKSKHLLLSPQLASLLTGTEIKKSVSHSGAMDKAQAGIHNKQKALNTKIEKNVKALESNHNDFYAKNSLDFNIMNLQHVPDSGQIFNTLFQHQEMVKDAHGIQNPTAQAQVGIDNAKRLYPGQPTDEGWSFLYSRNGKNYFQKHDGSVISTNGPKMTNDDWTKFLQSETPAHKAERLARQQGANHYGYTNGVVEPVINRPQLNPADLSPDFHPQTFDVPDTTITTGGEANRLRIANNPKSRFNEPLHWYDVAGPIGGLTEGRIPVRYNGADLNQIRLKLQNPLPSLQQGQRDFNDVLSQLPQNSQGYTNASDLFSKKYGIDNQVLGQYENINTGIKNQETQYNAGVKDRQSLINQQARGVFEDQRLGSLEAQRLQRRTDWDSLTNTVAQNHALNRNGNLVMQLFPAFDQNAQYNGYRVPFQRPMNFPNSVGEEGLPANTSIITNTNQTGKPQYFIKNADGTLKEIKFKGK